MTTPDRLRAGREAFDRQAWSEAFAHLLHADQERPLVAHDLERLATAAYLTGHDGESTDAGIAAELLARSFPDALAGLNARTYGPPGLEPAANRPFDEIVPPPLTLQVKVGWAARFAAN